MATWLICLLLLVSSPAWAEIWAWEDADGVRRFTNHEQLIPPEYADRARVLVHDVATTEEPETPPSRRAEARAPERRLAQVVYDRPPAAEDDARRPADGVGLARDVEVRLEPLTVAPVAIAQSFPVRPYPVYERGAPVTTGFDRGRSRHRTLRMRIHEAYDVERCPPPGYLYPWEGFVRRGVPRARRGKGGLEGLVRLR